MSSFRPAKSTTEMSNVAHKSYYGKRAFQLHVGNFVSSSSSNWNQVHENKNMWYHAWKIIMFIELKWIFTYDFWNHYRMIYRSVQNQSIYFVPLLQHNYIYVRWNSLMVFHLRCIHFVCWWLWCWGNCPQFQQKSILIKRNVICARANCLVPIVRIDTYLHYNKSITAIINLYYLKTSYFIFPFIPAIEPFFMILSANTPFKRLPHM